MQAPGGTTEDPTGGFKYSGWLPPYSDEASAKTVGDLFDRSFDLLLGRRTYDIFAQTRGSLYEAPAVRWMRCKSISDEGVDRF